MDAVKVPKTKSKKPVKQPKNLAYYVNLPLFSKLYPWFSLFVLLATTLYWSYKSAVIQLNNADQLVDPYLFTNSRVFHAAQFPGAHSFLIKWPLFWLIRTLDFVGPAYTWFTVALVLIAVGGLVFILRKIERRPLYFGTLVLALASVLLLVPAEPYAGALLPVNMAMLATRNIEYLLYIASLLLIIKARRLVDWRLGAAIVLQIFLFASDKLFLAISLGGAIICLFVFALDRSWRLVALGARWLLTGLLAASGGLLALWLINSQGWTTLVGNLGSSPYSLVSTSHNIVLGAIYAGAGLLTQFGANPAYDVGLVKQLPHQFLQRLFSLSGIGFLINLLLLAVVLWAVVAVVARRFKIGYQLSASGKAEKLAFTLLASSLAAIGFFVATNHYYFVDSRYLTIALFGLFVTMAVWLRQKVFSPQQLAVAGALICVGLMAGLWAAHNQYRLDNQTLAGINQRNVLAAQALKSRQEQILVGDYWRVVPIKFMIGGKINILPLDTCSQPRSSLTSKVWNTNLYNHSFAYLLPLDKGPAGFQMCNLQQVLSSYGRPNASTVIAGDIDQPKGLLLFYDHGIIKPKSTSKTTRASTVVPINLSDLTQSFCRNTVMNIVAHQDDDLLFMNPDLYYSIQDGTCQRTVYLTAGDAGSGSYYWLGREKGSQAAYDAMAGLTNSVWIERIVKLAANEFIAVDSPHGNNKLSLIFMRLPDGNLRGQGFKQNKYESLAKLDMAKISAIHSVDGQSTYTAEQLTAAINSLMQFYQPNLVRTQASYASKMFPDHSDHMAAGQFARHALSLYDPGGSNVPVRFYIGYPIHAFAVNITPVETQQKLTIFLAYSAFDKSACQSVKQCGQTATYNAYINRQYTNPY